MVSPAVVLLMALTSVAVVGTSHAQQISNAHGQQRSVTVRYEDLNLSSVEGSSALYRRLVRAAEKVCPARDSVQTLRANREATQCIADAVERATQQIKSVRFAEVAASRRR